MTIVHEITFVIVIHADSKLFILGKLNGTQYESLSKLPGLSTSCYHLLKIIRHSQKDLLALYFYFNSSKRIGREKTPV